MKLQGSTAVHPLLATTTQARSGKAGGWAEDAPVKPHEDAVDISAQGRHAGANLADDGLRGLPNGKLKALTEQLYHPRGLGADGPGAPGQTLPEARRALPLSTPAEPPAKPFVTLPEPLWGGPPGRPPIAPAFGHVAGPLGGVGETPTGGPTAGPTAGLIAGPTGVPAKAPSGLPSDVAQDARGNTVAKPQPKGDHLAELQAMLDAARRLRPGDVSASVFQERANNLAHSLSAAARKP